MPGSGKSSYSETLRDSVCPDALIVSSDDVRWTFSQGREYKAAAERYVGEVMTAFVRGCLLYGRSVIHDATNLTRNKRAILAWYAREYGHRSELHYIRCSPKESERRSRKWIASAGIHHLADTFEEPQDDEGFNRMVTVDGEKGWVVIEDRDLA
jgi:predicted kinase